MHEPKELFPLLAEIEDREIMKITTEVWIEVQKQRSDLDVKEIPFTLLIPTRKTLIEHTNTVTRMAYEIGKGRSDLNLNLVIAGGLLHDVGKVLTYKKDTEKTLRHPLVGAALLSRYDNLDLVHIVFTHSHEGDHLIRSKESIVVHHCDFIDFEIEKLRSSQ
ncbi:MAG TPA: HDIG domain-containing protein [bacterium (Candidatus Stahlbacteria)]|nr:HDIG domain-containing protein [Candidatus Stahlbacteria bacterium]